MPGAVTPSDPIPQEPGWRRGLRIVWPLLLLTPLLYTLQLSGIDLWLQQRWFDAPGDWWWPKDEPFGRLVLYDGIKHGLVILGIALLGLLTLGRQHAWVRSHRRGLLIVLASMVLVPTIVAGLKSISGVPCPRQLEIFGGSLPDMSIFDWRPVILQQPRRPHCFPAGHASAGFALMSLYFLFHHRRAHLAGLAAGTALGSLMGAYKMLIGDHFLSHTLATALIAWFIICLLAIPGRRAGR